MPQSAVGERFYLPANTEPEPAGRLEQIRRGRAVDEP
jgi:hypothetical protein